MLDPTPTDRPNILWIIAEDLGPQLGAYGTRDAITPNLDALADEGIRFTRAFSTGPVCSVARSTLISGMYPTSLGSQTHRADVAVPEHVRLFPEYLREAGYYCFNGFSTLAEVDELISADGYQTKFDYNIVGPTLEAPLPAWDAASGSYPPRTPAHWRDRAAGQPFFAQIGFVITHHSNYGGRSLPEREGWYIPLSRITPEERHDPATVELPAHHPDTPGGRQLWAEYHDCITEMDHQVGELLRLLDEDGLADDTIVFFFGDNGSGMIGGKSWLWNEGLHVPLIVRCPERFRHLVGRAPGTVDERIVGFEDFGPTALRLAGVPVPGHMHGAPFLGGEDCTGREAGLAFGIRDRLDDWEDLIRSVRDERHLYIRNLLPHRPWT